MNPQIVGAWYEIANYPIVTLPAKCTGHVLYENDDGTIAFTVMYLGVDTLDAYELYGTGIADVPNSAVDVTFSTGLNINMQFVHSDYSTFAIMYGCQEVGPDTSVEFAWVVSSTPTLTPAAYAEVSSYVAANLDADAFVDTPQDAASCYGEPIPTKN